MSKANNGDDDDDDEQSKNSSNDQTLNIKRIYQRVQQDDSDWYYSTLSKFLGEEALLDNATNGLDADKDHEGDINMDSGDSGSASFDQQTQPRDRNITMQTPDKIDRPSSIDGLRDESEPMLHPTDSTRNHKTSSNRLVHDDKYDGYNPKKERHDAVHRHTQHKKVDTREKTNPPKKERKSPQIV